MTSKAEKYIEDGFVIGRHGRWVPIEQAIAEEEQWFEQVRRGKVLLHGQWVPIEDAVAAAKSGGGAASRGDGLSDKKSREATDADEYVLDQDTKVIDIHALQGATAPADTESAANTPPEGSDAVEPPFGTTDSIAIDPAGDETPAVPHKPDTVRLEIGSAENSEDSDKILEPQIPLFGEEEWGAARRRYYTLIAGCAVAAALIATGIFLLLRFFH